MNSFGKAVGGGRRKAARRGSGLLISTISTLESDYRVGLVNLSEAGAQLTAPELPEEGEEIILWSDGIEAPGRIAWKKGAQCGITFDSPMSSNDVDRLRKLAEI